MMGGKTPETCWAVNKCQNNKLKNCCIWLKIYLNCTMMHGLTNLKCKKRLLFSSCLSVCPTTCNNSTATGRVFIKLVIWVFFENMPRKFKFHWNQTRITGTLHEDKHTFLIISRPILLKLRNVSDKNFIEIQTHISCSIKLFRKSFRLWNNAKKTVGSDRSQMTMYRVRIACWITKYTNTYLECLILITVPL
jgi:hypothetical protein